jgi:S-adenosylmethionine decarboxylase
MPNALGQHHAAVPHKDYFSERDGQRFAGTHLIVDLWEAKHLNDSPRIEAALREAALAAKATVLHGHFHVFTPLGGVTGMLLLAESHISIHTWPERGFAAVDLFMCAGCDPHDGIDAIKRWFEPQRITVKTLRRGDLPTSHTSNPSTPQV